MTKQHIHIGVEDSKEGLARFIDAWHRAEKAAITPPEIHLNFEDLSMLMALLTPRRLELLKCLRQQGPFSVRALAKTLERDYKNVHSDVTALEAAGLIERNSEDLILAPWDVIDAHVRLVA
ncbi:MAG TPA: MarR family transcriptional regulator [Gammaproteobacteria bacterium]